MSGQPTKKARTTHPDEFVVLNNGIQMPMIGLGTWKSPAGKTGAAVKSAIEAGYRLIDCANDYGNEAEIGDALKEVLAADNGVERKDLFIQAKLWNTNHRKEHVKLDLMATLEDLKLDYIDSFVIHWPQACPANGKNEAVCRAPLMNKAAMDKDGKTMFPIADSGLYCSDNESHYIETWKAMEDLVKEGLVKSIGLSNFNATQIREVLAAATIKPATLQNECHPYLQQQDLIDVCTREGIRFQSYSPLGSRDSPFRTAKDPILLEEPDILAIAKKYNKTAAQIVLRWHVERGCGAVPKSVTPSRIAGNYDIFDFKLTAEDLKVMGQYNYGWRHCLWPETALHPDYPFKDELPYSGPTGYKVGKAPLDTSSSSL